MIDDSAGISPVIASVLIILVAVSMASAYIVFTDRIFGGVTESGEETVSRTTQELFSDFTISSASGQRVFIKNTGTSELSASALDIFYDSEPIEFAADFQRLEEDELGTLTLRELWRHGPGTHTIRITAGSFQDTASVNAEPHQGAIAYWKLDEGSGTTTEDSSGNGKTGTLQGDSTWTDGTSGSAVSFDGDGDYIDVNDIVGGQRQLTVAAWVNTRSAVGTDYFVGEGTAFRLGVTNAGEAVCWHRGDDDSGSDTKDSVGTTTSPLSPLTEWYHIHCTWDGNSKERNLYVNGELEASDTSTVAEFRTGNNNAAIGDGYVGQGSYIDGSVDEVLLYSQIVEPNELYELSLR